MDMIVRVNVNYFHPVNRRTCSNILDLCELTLFDPFN